LSELVKKKERERERDRERGRDIERQRGREGERERGREGERERGSRCAQHRLSDPSPAIPQTSMLPAVVSMPGADAVLCGLRVACCVL